MKITINILKRHLYAVAFLFAVFLVLTFAIAGNYVNPTTKVGHDGDEIGVMVNGQIKSLPEVITVLQTDIQQVQSTQLTRFTQGKYGFPSATSGCNTKEIDVGFPIKFAFAASCHDSWTGGWSNNAVENPTWTGTKLTLKGCYGSATAAGPVACWFAIG